MQEPNTVECNEAIELSPEGEGVRIRDLAFTSRAVHEYLSLADDPAAECRRALEIGCVSLSRVATLNHTDMLDKKVGELRTDITELVRQSKEALCEQSKRIENQLDETRKDSLISVMHGQFEERANALTACLSETFSEDGQAAAVLKKVLETDGIERLVSSFKKEIGDFRDAMTEQLTLLKTPEKASHAIGKTHEEAVWEEISAFCGHTGYIPSDLRNVSSTGSSKVGDFKISHETIKSITIEAKNRSRSPSVQACLEELGEAQKNRNAEYAIMVLPQDQLPAGVEDFNEYAGGKSICSLEVFGVVLKVAAAKAQHNNDAAKDINEADMTRAKELSQELHMLIGRFGKLKANIGALRKTSVKIESLADGIRAELEEKSSDLLIALNPVSVEEACNETDE